jgi:hypothetical protein
MFEQGGSSRNIPVIELSSSSDEEGFFVDTTWDAEFAKQLFGDLNHDLLGSPDNGKMMIISDSDEEEEAHEETTANAEAVPSAVEKSLTLAFSTTDANEDPNKMQDDNSDDHAPG